jgi:hypothetical protein
MHQLHKRKYFHKVAATDRLEPGIAPGLFVLHSLFQSLNYITFPVNDVTIPYKNDATFAMISPGLLHCGMINKSPEFEKLV